MLPQHRLGRVLIALLFGAFVALAALISMAPSNYSEDDLVALAHELNQPLTAILSNVQAAQRFMTADPIDLAELRVHLARRLRRVPGVVGLAGPRPDGSFVVAASGDLSVLAAGGPLRPFARGPRGYVTARGPEPYIALSENAVVAGAGCSFSQDTLYAVEPGRQPGVILVDARGRARRVVDLPAGLLPDGIAFDGVGRFGHRLLVAVLGSRATTLVALDCNGAKRTVAVRAPVVEGGAVVAPTSFGRFGGDLIVPDEHTGRVVAIDPGGRAITVVRSGLPSGSDIGVESAGFVPPGFGPTGAAYLADRFSRGSPHPGTNSILRLTGRQLARAGVRPGDLLVASEGGAETIAVRCGQRCTVTHIANGPAVAHAEGHIVFASAPG